MTGMADYYRPRKTAPHQKTRSLQTLADGVRLFGDRSKPDKHGVSIPTPGTDTKLMKPRPQHGSYRPVDTLSSTSFVRANSASGRSSHSGGKPQRNSNDTDFRPLRREIKSDRVQEDRNTDEPSSKRQRVEGPTKKAMTEEYPIVVEDDDDLMMDHQDELGQSSDRGSRNYIPTGRTLFAPPSQASTKNNTSNLLQIDEYQKVEKLMTPGKRAPLLFRGRNDDLSQSEDDELFTKESKEQRLRSKKRPSLSPRAGPAITEEGTAAAHSGPRTPPILKGVFYPSPGKALGNEADSPDAIQVVTEVPHEGIRSAQISLHEGLGDGVADATNRPQLKSTKKDKRNSNDPDFRVQRLKYGSLPTDYPYSILVDRDNKMLTLRPENPPLLDDDRIHTISMTKVLNILYGKDDCTIVALLMSRSEGALDTKLYVDFPSHKQAWDFVMAVQACAGSSTVDVNAKESDQMESMFENKQPPKPVRETTTNSRKGISTSSPPFPGSSHSKPKRTSLRYTDQLESTKPDSINTKRPTVISGKDRSTTDNISPMSARNGFSEPEAEKTRSTIKASLSKFFESPATRSSTKSNMKLSRDSEFKNLVSKVKFSETGRLGDPWKKPLVFPRIGKKRETVDFQDLVRLDEDEFLNDNLIGFYLRYLEHFLEQNSPDVARKVHFFNSYFFERLTQPQKGTKGVNYAAVQKWTRTVDIFSRDFVVVPVNENLHWYVAIICNLPNLRRKLADDGDEEVEEEEVEDLGPPEAKLSTSANAGGDIQSEVELGDDPESKTNASLAEMSLNEERHVVPASDETPIVSSDIKQTSPTRPKRVLGRRKSARRSLPKIDPEKPVVITLDSLGLGRSATRTALKDYVVEEGKAKRSLELEREAFGGVTAKGIPTQKNYSDCGLFVCAYMEMFVLDPYKFVHNILQRDMDDAKNWPVYSSDDLRSRLRNLIQELHREQEGETSQVPIPEVGQILLQRPVPTSSHSEFGPEVEEVEKIEEKDDHATNDAQNMAAASQINDDLTAAARTDAQASLCPQSSQGAYLQSAIDAVDESSYEQSRIDPRSTPDSAIIIADDTPTSPGPRHMSSRLKSHSKPAAIDSIKGPQELADMMRRERSPSGVRQDQPMNGSANSMQGIHGFAGKMPGGFEDEIPETQSQTPAESGTTDGKDDFPQEILSGL